jgi:hypothetical protein
MPTTPLESKLERTVVIYATYKDMLHLKLNVRGRVGWPDQLFIYKGVAFFIEFKREGEQPTKAQLFIHELIRAHGLDVGVFDNYNDAKEFIDDHCD